MGRISATFKRSSEGIAKAYAEFYGISFSESVEILTTSAGLEWFGKLPKAKQKEYTVKFEIIKQIK